MDKGPRIFSVGLPVFLNWDSLVMARDSWFFTRWVPGLTITICYKTTTTWAGKMGSSCLLGIFPIFPASKRSLFGHIIKPHIIMFQTTNMRTRWLNISLILFCAFIDLNFISINNDTKNSWSISSHLDDLMLGLKHMGRRGALTSHQCGPHHLYMWFSPLLWEGFNLGTPVFPFPQRPTLPNSNSTRIR